jgi:site-specific DNA recombinase
MMAVHAALYARYSTEMQRETSLDDQIAVARRYALEQGWAVLDDHIYTDAAISGGSLDRAGIQGLLAAAERRPPPFDVLLVDDSSRVSRDLADAVRFMQRLKFCGIRVLYLAQHIDSANEQAETLIAVHGMVDSLYIKEMAKKIKRGLAGQLERGFATGAITFGYRTVAVPDPSGKLDVNGYPVLLGKRVEVVPEEARAIVQIFEWYASGLGIGRIIERLHQEGCRGPRGRRWRDGAVKRILANEKYRGFLIWGKSACERRPGTRQIVERRRPRDEWRMHERPELRIVPEDLWQRVVTRRQAIRSMLPAETGRTLMRGRGAALYSRHLFSGFMSCGVCGKAVVTVTGGKGSPRYGCQHSWRNGTACCANRLTVRAKVADAYRLAGLRAELLCPAVATYIIEALTAALNHRIDERPRLLEEARTAREETAHRLQRLIEAIEHGVAAGTLAAAIAERQREIERLDATLAELAEPVHQRLAVMPAWVRQQMEDVAGLLASSPERTKTEFQRLGVRVTMTPARGENGRAFYRAAVVNSLPCLTGTTDLRGNPVSTVDRLDLPATP